MSTTTTKTHVCPWWFIHMFDNPVRRLFQNPDTILKGFVQPGYHCLDIGCGYGYFSIPMAKLVGFTGSVTAADLQPEMLSGVRQRAEKAGVSEHIKLLRVDSSGLAFNREFDFILTFWMMHEVPNQELLLNQLSASLKPGGHFLLVEPKGHVSSTAFATTVRIAEQTGFSKTAEPPIAFSRSVLFTLQS